MRPTHIREVGVSSTAAGPAAVAMPVGDPKSRCVFSSNGLGVGTVRRSPNSRMRSGPGR